MRLFRRAPFDFAQGSTNRGLSEAEARHTRAGARTRMGSGSEDMTREEARLSRLTITGLPVPTRITLKTLGT